MKPKALITFVTALILIVLSGRAFAQRGCYSRDIAYVKWFTIIRKQPVLWGNALALAAARDRYHVLDSKRVMGNCWVQTTFGKTGDNVGWLLLAENLIGEPLATPMDGMQSNMPSVRHPLIRGDTDFIGAIARALAFLRVEAPRWYLYVTKPDYSVEPCGPCPAGKSWAQWLDGPVYIHKNDYNGEEF